MIEHRMQVYRKRSVHHDSQNNWLVESKMEANMSRALTPPMTTLPMLGAHGLYRSTRLSLREPRVFLALSPLEAYIRFLASLFHDLRLPQADSLRSDVWALGCCFCRRSYIVEGSF